ncbi:MAG TPA: ATP-dependent dethiobiotin synthetase BioD, partial [Leptospiraceae bacterium]|nr:ATP-dependent dethiobiotin synthetase BioD [Leptospiraceae bacterium]
EKDSDEVRKISSVSIIPSVYEFTFPASPHYSAELESREIDFEFLLDEMKQKKSEKIISEGAGGILVPLNRRFLFADLLERLRIPVLICASSVLGTVNHTLLTLQNLDRRNIPVLGFFFCGADTEITEDSAFTIEKFSGVKYLGRTDFPNRSLAEKEFRQYADENFDHDFIIKDVL